MVLLPLLAATSRTVPALLHQHHRFALAVNVRYSSLFRPEVNSFVNSLQKRTYRKQQHVIQASDFSNFTKMLQQYQDLPQNNRRDGKNTTRGADNNFTRRHDTDPYQRHDVTPKITNPIVTADTNSNSQAQSHNEYAYRKDRPRWRIRNNADSNVIVNATSKRNVTTSEWLHIYGTPPMSKLSDLFPCLNQIINYELAKGIINLDTILHDPRYFNNRAMVDAMEKVGALDTLYPTSQIINDVVDDNSCDNIPLWSPREECTTINLSSLYDICPMILEARVQLSYRALPVGWFIRLPSRSVVHAVLNHIRRAEQDKWGLSNEDKILKQHRKEWREGLWKGVYAEYEYAAGKKEMMLSVQQEGRDEKELMWGEDKWDEEPTDDLSLENATEGGDGNQTLPLEASEENADDYIQRYSQSYPYSPSQSMDRGTRQASPYHLMKSGSKILSVREFSPHPLNISSFSKEKENLPWEQHAFSLSSHLKLSDSVVRVETSDLTATEEDIQYYFRGYDLMAIKEDTRPDVSSYFTNYTRSIGWNITSTGIVDLLTVERKHTDRKHGTQRVFLVHFASSAEARMAIRDKDGKLEEGFGLSLTAYPNTIH